MMADIPAMADLAATISVTILIGTALFTAPAPVQGPDIGMTTQQIQAANAAARARIGG